MAARRRPRRRLGDAGGDVRRALDAGALPRLQLGDARRRAAAPPAGKLDGIDPTARIHPTAIIQPPVRIGSEAHLEANTRIGPYAVVGARATVPAGTELVRGVIWADTKAVIR